MLTWGGHGTGFLDGAGPAPAARRGTTSTTAPPPVPDTAADAAIRDVEIATAAAVEGAAGPGAPAAQSDLGAVCAPLLGLLGQLAGVAATHPQVKDRVGVLSATVMSIATQRGCPSPADAPAVPPSPLCVGEPASASGGTGAHAAAPDSGVTVEVLKAPAVGTVAPNIERLRASLRLTNTGGKAVKGPVTVLATVGNAKGDTVVVGGGAKDVDLGPGRSANVTVDVVGACKGSKVSIRIGSAGAPASASFTVS